MSTPLAPVGWGPYLKSFLPSWGAASKPAAAQSSKERVYTWAEVNTHNRSDSSWIVIAGNIYDVTRFKNEHPGGLDVLQERFGEDATGSFEGVGHSDDARARLQALFIGRVANK